MVYIFENPHYLNSYRVSRARGWFDSIEAAENALSYGASLITYGFEAYPLDHVQAIATCAQPGQVGYHHARWAREAIQALEVAQGL